MTLPITFVRNVEGISIYKSTRRFLAYIKKEIITGEYIGRKFSRAIYGDEKTIPERIDELYSIYEDLLARAERRGEKRGIGIGIGMERNKYRIRPMGRAYPQ